MDTPSHCLARRVGLTAIANAYIVFFKPIQKMQPTRPTLIRQWHVTTQGSYLATVSMNLKQHGTDLAGRGSLEEEKNT